MGTLKAALDRSCVEVTDKILYEAYCEISVSCQFGRQQLLLIPVETR